MVELKPLRPRWAIAAALIAVVFGIVTIFVGGNTLFGGAEERAAAAALPSEPRYATIQPQPSLIPKAVILVWAIRPPSLMPRRPAAFL